MTASSRTSENTRRACRTVEARDAGGGFFGQQRFVELLERGAASAQPPAETARRLTHAVLDHERGVLQDDATVLLAHWDP